MSHPFNPFETRFWQPGQIDYHFPEPDITAESLFEKIRRQRICQIAGQHGSGKSALLQTLARCCRNKKQAVRYVLLNERNRTLPGDLLPGEEPLVLFDGFEQLSFLRQCGFRFRFRNAFYVITTHRQIAGIPVLYRTQPVFEIFYQLVAGLTRQKPDKNFLRQVFQNSGGNFRSAFFELYDRCPKDLYGQKDLQENELRLY
ncbi:hypothetical protein FACS189419_01070 [Planctomycetales bacterium]|nr:hypothetical protein FACS189419_01070 [Planctomycetales bacterium]